MKNFLLKYVLLSLAISSIYTNAVNAAPAKSLATQTVSIQDAWVRQTRGGQDVGAAYMTLTSPQNITLVSIESDVTKSIEIHSMTMKNGIMKMRMLDTLPLAANKPYKLAPGGFHLMLFDLKKPLNIGEHVNFVLHFKLTNNKVENSKMKNDANNTSDEKEKSVEFTQTVSAIVKTSADENAAVHQH